MARRRRAADLAGLAALGALAYKLGPGRTLQAPAPVEDRMPVPVTRELRETYMGMDDTGAAPAVSGGPSADDLSRFMDVGTNVNESGDVYYPGGVPAVARPVAARAVAPRAADMSAAAADAGFANRAPVIGPRSTGRGGYTAAEIEAYRRQQEREAMRGRGYNRADSAPAARPRQMTREDLISQIPTGGTQTVSGGDRVSGNEFTRNVGNTLMGMGPTRLAGFSNAAIEGATARGAAQRAASLSAERAEAARRGQAGTKFSSTSSKPATRANEAAKRTRKFDEDMAETEFKRGGKTKAKPKKMASGGMSSASKRGDGIASKGKTKCKMY